MPKEKTTRKSKPRVERKKKGMSQSPHGRPSWTLLTTIADPNAPKRGLSAYMFFANDNREKVREENPGITFGKMRIRDLRPAVRMLTALIGQVGKMLGEKWKALDDKERKPYEEKAAADKKRYEEEKATYNNVSSPRPQSHTPEERC